LHWLICDDCSYTDCGNRHARTHAASPHRTDHRRQRLAACATLIPAVQSIYRWHGEVESATETLLLLKTAPEQLTALEARLHELHSYETPEFLVLKADAASQPYLDWLHASLRQP
jgi:periplasmic divalent cation tolerance protein